MIERIGIENFKIFNSNTIFDGLKPLTILTGINGRGKSTMLQTLIALSQSVRHNGDITQLNLNGDQIELGTAIDVKNINSRRENDTVFSFFINASKIELTYSFPYENAPYLQLKAISIDGNDDDQGQDLLKNYMKNVTFISAERLGPKLGYPGHNDHEFIGARGEYAPCALFNNKDLEIDEKSINTLPDFFPEVKIEELDRTFIGILNFWMSKMFRPSSVDVDYIADTNNYTLKYSNLDAMGRFKPTNVGFGYSYALPIIIAGLLAKKESTLIIENPEAHLHPLAQSILGKFLVWLTEKGTQVFVETHSEHILNAPRVLIVQEVFSDENLGVIYFDERCDSGHINIVVEDSGLIKKWPDGFFDQFEKDNDTILGL